MQLDQLRRRKYITLLGAATDWNSALATLTAAASAVK
jgi:hypothetical protein